MSAIAKYIPPIESLADTEWGAELDFTDPLIAEPDELLRLYQMGPDDEARAFIVGIMDTRQTLASVTGVEFVIPEGEIDHPLNRADPDWMDGLDHIDALLCSSGELSALLEAAPTAELKAFITGIIDVRQMLNLVAGAEF